MRNRVKSATSTTRNFIDTKAQETDLPKQVETEPKDLMPAVNDTPPVEVEENQQPNTQVDDQIDDSWLDELTPFEFEQPPVQQTAPVAPPQPVTANPVDDRGTEEQQRRLQELYKNLDHVEEEAAQEVYQKLVQPDVSRIEAELNQLKQERQIEIEQKATAIRAEANKKIFAKYPNAEKFLRSKEFMDLVNQTSNPYSKETQFDILSRAYYAGDADYVLTEIDKFVASRGKPKPPVGVEPQQGGGRSGVVETQRGNKPMSDETYRAKRRAILSAPKGTYPPNALKDLVTEYMNSRG